MSFHSKPIQSGWKKFWGKEFPEKKPLYRDKRTESTLNCDIFLPKCQELRAWFGNHNHLILRPGLVLR